METTFINIVDLSPSANILYSSDSIIDILGYSPDDVLNTSCWNYFHPEELPLARTAHDRGIQLDKASVLSYCRMKGQDGQWIGCEVVFTVVYDVIVGCTSIYRRGLKSQSRAAEAPAVRRLFSTSPRDPRYHMLSHLSGKLTTPLQTLPEYHEPRAALFLNRYTRTLTVMYATEGLADVLGISGADMRGKSFYYCIQENCLKDAVRCLENAKANNSIAYLRFWYRDPRHDDRRGERNQAEDRAMEEAPLSSEQMDVDLPAEQAHDRQDRLNHQSREDSHASIDSEPLSSTDSISPVNRSNYDQHLGVPGVDSRTSSDESNVQYSHEAVFGEPREQQSSASSDSRSSSENGGFPNDAMTLPQPIELEAVISCTSDGLVVCLRQAAPFSAVPRPQQSARVPADQGYKNGLFAVPWAKDPLLPTPQERSQQPQRTGFAPSLTPAQAYHRPLAPSTKPPQHDFMTAIRDCAVFAWALTGINGSLAEYSRGTPRGESQPSSGLPVWQSDSSSQNASGPTERPAFPSPSSIATGGYFSKPPTKRSRTSEYRPSNSSHNGIDLKAASTVPQGESQAFGRPYTETYETTRQRSQNENQQHFNGTNGSQSPSMPSHEVDGVEAMFDNQRDPFSPDRDMPMAGDKHSSDQANLDSGQIKATPPHPLKAPPTNHYHSGAAPFGSNGFQNRPARQYYDPARTDL